MKEDVYEVLGIATNTVTDENLVVCRKVQDPVGIIWERPEQKRFERMDAEYVPETNDGDTISRKAVLDIAFKYCPDDDGVCSEAGSDLRNMLDEIENLPPADEPSKVARDIARIVENEQDMRVIAQSEKRTETHGVCLDAISRQAAIMKILRQPPELHYPSWYAEQIKELPPAEPDKDKVNDLLYHIYSIQSPHLSMTGVIAKKYYCEELWKELFGKESELPGWMN